MRRRNTQKQDKNNSGRNRNSNNRDSNSQTADTKFAPRPPKKKKQPVNKSFPQVNLGEYRLNKFISDSGYCSRREADTFINKGLVQVNGKVVGIGSKVSSKNKILVNGNLISHAENIVYIALNKPVGVVSSTEKGLRNNIVSFVNYPDRIFPIGRLDKESEGLILLTNDGDIVNKILRAGNNHEKEYLVHVNKKITKSFIEQMGNGVPILETVTKKCYVEKIDDYNFKIILIQGLNRQIRRMCEHLGYEVRGLKRHRIMNVNLGKLPVGKWRFLTEKEMRRLNQLISDSTNEA